MIHARMVRPHSIAWGSERSPEQISRLQDLSGDLALNRVKLCEIGRLNLLGYRKKTPALTGRARQLENGDMSYWYSLANRNTPGSGESHYVDETMFQSSSTDLIAYLTDDDAIFTGSIRFPHLRISGFTVNIGDPDAMLERNFNLVSEGYDYLNQNYFAYATATSGAHSGEETLDVVMAGGSGNPPVPVEYAAGKYIFRVLRVRGTLVTDLTLLEDEGSAPAANTWKYDNGTKTVTVQSCLTGDVVKVFYAAATPSDVTWADDDSHPTVLLAEYCEVSMKIGSSERIYRLQSVGIDVTLERSDYKEIGNNEIVEEGVKQTTVKISLNRFMEGMTFEQILANDTVYPYLNPADFASTIQFQVKVFSEKEHTNFKIGYLSNKVSPTAVGNSQTVQDYLKATTTLESDNMKISDIESEIAFA